eukprot:1155174-Pelagomonas_calceolata.AAC.2
MQVGDQKQTSREREVATGKKCGWGLGNAWWRISEACQHSAGEIASSGGLQAGFTIEDHMKPANTQQGRLQQETYIASAYAAASSKNHCASLWESALPWKAETSKSRCISASDCTAVGDCIQQ